MNPIDGAYSRRSRPSNRLWLAGTIIIAITAALAALNIWSMRADAIAHSRQEMISLGTVLAEQTARSFQAVDLVLQETRGMVLAAGWRVPINSDAKWQPKRFTNTWSPDCTACPRPMPSR